jgi:hypothetical protein
MGFGLVASLVKFFSDIVVGVFQSNGREWMLSVSGIDRDFGGQSLTMFAHLLEDAENDDKLLFHGASESMDCSGFCCCRIRNFLAAFKVFTSMARRARRGGILSTELHDTTTAGRTICQSSMLLARSRLDMSFSMLYVIVANKKYNNNHQNKYQYLVPANPVVLYSN